MRKFLHITTLLLIITSFTECNYFTFTPRSRYNKKHEMPSVILLSKIIEYREEFGEWPFSKENFIARGTKYKDAFAEFRYLYTKFDIVDNDKMNFTFSQHIKDVATYKSTNKIDLNGYGGEVRFYKKGNKFTWKAR